MLKPRFLRWLPIGLVALAVAAPVRVRADAPDFPPPPRLPANLLRVAPLPGGRLVLVTEKASQSLLVYRFDDGGAELLEVLPCTTGKAPGDKQVEGDLRTPEGVYWFTRYIPDRALPPLYGAGAFVMDYPNDFDRLDGKTGGGIWLHGVETDERAHVPNDTRGCVAVRNGDFDRLAAEVRRHLRETPIVVVDGVAWSDETRLAAEAAAVEAFLESWRESWEAGRLSVYLDHYAPEFEAEGLDLDGWAARKGEIFRRSSLIRVAIDDLVILREKDRVWARFRQEYLSDGLRDVGRKELHLRAQDPEQTTWRIVGEGWSPLDEGFALLDPDTLAVPVTFEQVATLAPDAAPAGTTPAPAADVPTAFAQALEPTLELALEPEPAGQAAPPGAERVEPAPPAAPPAPTATPEPAPPEPAAAVEPVAPPAARPAAPPAALEIVARPEEPAADRGWFRLIGPHAQRRGPEVLFQVQLLNLRPSAWREGTWRLEASLPDGRTLGEPGDGAEGRPFRLRQGEILALALPAPDGPGRIVVAATVRDPDGRVALRQDVVLEISSRP